MVTFLSDTATATLDPRPRLWTRDPRPATISQTRQGYIQVMQSSREEHA